MPRAGPRLELAFDGRSYCFTGTLADLKRTQAARETRARGGLTINRVNRHLDYLVVGSIPSIGWKYGTYGTKIELARELAQNNQGRPQLVPESAFVEALCTFPVTGSGAIDEKVVVINYKFLAADEDAYDCDGLELALRELKDATNAHVSVRSHWGFSYADLFGEDGSEPQTVVNPFVVECRLVKQFPLDGGTADFLATVERAFEGVEGVDGSLHYFERVEGSADFVRLLREIPQRLRAPVATE